MTLIVTAKMAFNNKDLTQGGQVFFYMVRMFIQVNKIIFHWLILAFVAISIGFFIFWNSGQFYALKMGYYYYFSTLLTHFTDKAIISVDLGKMQFEASASSILKHAEFIRARDLLNQQILLAVSVAFVLCLTGVSLFYRYLTKKGKKQSQDDYLSGRVLEKNPQKLAKMMKKKKIASDIVLGGLPIVNDSEIQNFIAHGTVGTGKSTLINQLIQQLKTAHYRHSDKIIIYDKGCSFLPKFYDPKKDYILNPLDNRCANWSLWQECSSKSDFENLAAALIPDQAHGDPFWNASARTIFANLAFEMRNNQPNYKDFLRNLLTVDVHMIRALLKNTEAENLTDSKIEKTTTSIRSVLTSYVKSLTYLQGLNEDNNRKKLVIRDWITDDEDNGILYITSNGAHHASIRPLISTWLSVAMTSLFSLGENRERRVWFIVDEIASLNKLPFLQTLLAEGRKFGGCFFIGLQNMAQLEESYGIKGGQAIFDLLNTRYFFRSPSYDMAKRVAQQIGKARYNVFSEQYSYGAQEVRDGVSFTKREGDKPVVTPDEIMQLADLTCLVTYPAELPVTKLTLKYQPYPEHAKGFIARTFDSSLKNESTQENHSETATSINAGTELQYHTPKKAKPEEKLHDNETLCHKKTNEYALHNREEVNINHAKDENYRSHDDMDIVP